MSDVDAGTAAVARLAELRERTGTDAAAAAEAAWGWLDELRGVARKDAAAAEPELNALFAEGSTPSGLDGATEGILVATTTNRVLDTAVKALTSVWMPWRGKRFDNDAGSGDNRMTESSSLVGKLLWPLYGMRTDADGKNAFDFETYPEPGVEDPDVTVMVIDYAGIPDNPTLVIRSIRDELVELLPGVYLGKIFFKMPKLTGDGRFERIGYFALRTP
ncbi:MULTISPECIES: hypothetical protein [unclassified Nocardioides]|uniref:hypothetical protein n=1 Tax=unclassified Nocardioides TaxID=2615069 RepID=UPI00070040CE|nr:MULTISPECIES: hypothetical protein [unclassified Nocardioides]KRA28122.1 hypothetical protein ASD81_23455 [Nocardioides sp. Root614]KRA86096.1 hypothetical protein ASD84_23695 [Nocardioides sp. Root682]